MRACFRELKPRTAAAGLARGFLPLRQCRQLHPAGERAAARPHFGPAAGAPAPVLEALAHILLGKLYRKPVARAYMPPIPAVSEPHGRSTAGSTGAADPRPEIHLRAPGRALQPGGDFRAAERAVSSTASWAAATRLEPAGRRAACWATSIPRTMRLSSAGFSIRREFRRRPGVCDVPRDAAPAISRGSQGNAAACAHSGIPRGGKTVPAPEGGEAVLEAAVKGA